MDRFVRDDLHPPVSTTPDNPAKGRPVTWLSARRRHPVGRGSGGASSPCLSWAPYSAVMTSPAAEAPVRLLPRSRSKRGRAPFPQNCSSCHGLGGEGSSDGPTIGGCRLSRLPVSTGWMPPAAPGAQAPDKAVTFTDEQIAAMAAYVATLGPGRRSRPRNSRHTKMPISPRAASCSEPTAQCHNFAGEGGPDQRQVMLKITGTSPKHIYEAMLTGPQSMPVFGDGTISSERSGRSFATSASLIRNPIRAGSGWGASVRSRKGP